MYQVFRTFSFEQQSPTSAEWRRVDQYRRDQCVSSEQRAKPELHLAQPEPGRERLAEQHRHLCQELAERRHPRASGESLRAAKDGRLLAQQQLEHSGHPGHVFGGAGCL